jgi:hypothetical protein
MFKFLGKAAIAAAALAALAGCIIINAEDHDGPNDRGVRACRAGDHQHLIGTQASAIDRTKLPSSFRIICHGCPATMDLNENRLSILLGPDNKVVSAACS